MKNTTKLQLTDGQLGKLPGNYQEQDKDQRKGCPLNDQGKFIIHDSQKEMDCNVYFKKNLCLYREERKTTMNYKRPLKAQDKKKAEKQKPRGKYFTKFNK